MPWELRNGSTVVPLQVLNRPALEAARAIEPTDVGMLVVYYGDRRVEPTPLALSVGIQAGDMDAALGTLRDILALARMESGTVLRYIEGPTTLERELQGMQGYECTRLEVSRGLLEVRLRLLPTGPYWRRISDNALMLWVW